MPATTSTTATTATITAVDQRPGAERAGSGAGGASVDVAGAGPGVALGIAVVGAAVSSFPSMTSSTLDTASQVRRNASSSPIPWLT